MTDRPSAVDIPPEARWFRVETMPLELAEQLQNDDSKRAPWVIVKNPNVTTKRSNSAPDWWPLDEEPAGDEVLAVLREHVDELALCRIKYTKRSRRQPVAMRVCVYNPVADMVIDEADHLDPTPDPEHTRAPRYPAPGETHRTHVPAIPNGARRRMGPGELGNVGGVPMTPVDLGGDGMRSDFALAHALTQQGQDKMLQTMTAVFGTCIQVVTQASQSQVAAIAELAKLHLAQSAQRDEQPERLSQQLREIVAQSEEQTRSLIEGINERLDEEDAEDELEAQLQEKLAAITQQMEGAKDKSFVEQFVGSDHGQALIAGALQNIIARATGEPQRTEMKQEPATPAESEEA